MPLCFPGRGLGFLTVGSVPDRGFPDRGFGLYRCAFLVRRAALALVGNSGIRPRTESARCLAGGRRTCAGSPRISAPSDRKGREAVSSEVVSPESVSPISRVLLRNDRHGFDLDEVFGLGQALHTDP
ncbi:hypothetical protein Stsp01_14620 [Streptomyces sp. NBRC 13847]|nr:hypothetical protein Stsp01_14620 [Streptomyces sp. NBRC 13847]